MLVLNQKSLFRKFYNNNLSIFIQSLVVILILLDYTFGQTLNHHIGNWLYLFIVIAIIASVSPHFKALSFLNGDLVLLAAYHALLGVFYIFAGVPNTPYDLMALHAIFETTYWFGVRGLLTSIATFILIFNIQILINLGDLISHDIYLHIIKLLLLIMLGLLVNLLVKSIRDEKEELITYSAESAFEHRRLRSLINSMADAVVATDKDGKIVLYNGAALILINTNQTITGKKLHDFIRPYVKGKQKLDLIEFAKEKDKAIKRDDLLFRNNDGEEINLYVNVAPVKISRGQDGEEGFICLLRDITKEKSIEEQRDEFISITSHELRTPIAITEANISTALLPKISKSAKKQRDLLEQAHSNIIFLSQLVDDITTLARAERGDLDTDIEDVDPADVVSELQKDYKSKAQKKKLSLKVETSKELPVIKSNHQRIKEILQDFVTNAIKYTDKGSVTIKTEPDKKGGVVFSVSDSGIGISKGDLNKVFDKFYRSEDFRTRSHSGTGLGLYIARKLAELIGGRVDAQSRLNKGSTFYLYLPKVLKLPPHVKKD